MSEEDLKQITPKDLEDQNRIIDYELKQMELTKGRVQILALNMGIVGGLLAIAKFVLEYGLAWFNVLKGGN